MIMIISERKKIIVHSAIHSAIIKHYVQNNIYNVGGLSVCDFHLLGKMVGHVTPVNPHPSGSDISPSQIHLS